MGRTGMTDEDQKLADDKARVEIANLNAPTAKLVAETSKIDTENLWYSIAIAIGTGLAGVLLTAGLGLGKLLLGG